MRPLESYASRDFWELYHKLPNAIRESADKQFALFQQDPSHPSLHLKPVGDFGAHESRMLIERWPFVKGTRFIGSGSAITTTMRDCSPDQFRAITYPHHSFSPQSQQLGPTAQVEPLHFNINSSRKGALKWNLTFRLKLTSAWQGLRSFYGKNACAMKSTWHSEAWTGDSSSNKHLKRAK